MYISTHTEEGAGVGHACSLITLTNLARLGNAYVAKSFDFHALRLAAIAITRVGCSCMLYCYR
jgi:hypothetical protein